MKILAVIPARSGSKRLPNKNTLNLCGKPLIQWTIEAALDCEELDTIMVSTDCINIANIATSAGASVPYLRSSDLSSDTASSVDVVLDVIRYYESIKENFDVIILLQPTSPLRTKADIKKAIKIYKEKRADAVISISECDHSPLWCNTLPVDDSMDSFISEDIKLLRSQDLPSFYRLNGAIYLVNIDKFKEKKAFIINNSYALKMSKYSSIDIDDAMDFEYAKSIMNNDLKCI
ncbi:TPA: cytidylyltransferase domain-containing protein [Photobacterium damselae]